MDELRQNQQALRDRLNKLLEDLKNRGLGQNQQGQQGQQGQGQNGSRSAGPRPAKPWARPRATSATAMPTAPWIRKGRALDALRKGAQGLAQSMQQQMGQGPGPGQNGRLGLPRAQRDTDPLGRPLRGRDYGDDYTVKVPGEIDVQRARRIIEELRRRFGDVAAPAGGARLHRAAAEGLLSAHCFAALSPSGLAAAIAEQLLISSNRMLTVPC